MAPLPSIVSNDLLVAGFIGNVGGSDVMDADRPRHGECAGISIG